MTTFARTVGLPAPDFAPPATRAPSVGTPPPASGAAEADTAAPTAGELRADEIGRVEGSLWRGRDLWFTKRTAHDDAPTSTVCSPWPQPLADDDLDPIRGGGDFSQAVAHLRRSAACLDRLWNETRTSAATARLATTLGEASHAVHRALITLTDPAVPHPPLAHQSRRRHG